MRGNRCFLLPAVEDFFIFWPFESLSRKSTGVVPDFFCGLASMSLVLRDIPRDCNASTGFLWLFLKVTCDLASGLTLAEPKIVGCRAARISGERRKGFFIGFFKDFCCFFGLTVLQGLETLDFDIFLTAFIGERCLDLVFIVCLLCTWLKSPEFFFDPSFSVLTGNFGRDFGTGGYFEIECLGLTG